MKKNLPSLLSAIAIIALVYWIFYAMMPQSVSEKTSPLSEFSTKRALQHVAAMSQKPHYVGSENHKTVAAYVETELQKLGLETKIQEGYTLSDWGNLVKSKNIIARINGSDNSKALLLLSHYDSAPHSASKGASDDASGIATILEGIRTFLHNKTAHKNDIIILFSDAEELGLNGAALFVTQNSWAKEVGLALNFEARGSSGPSYMLMEVNNGNAKMVDGFTEAGVRFPVSNSLMYSIYKMLPNDTDLTVFREQGKIQGLNFAFIDDHFNYHTQQDDLQHLSPETLAHQGLYLMPLLQYFSNANLNSLDSDSDSVYFNTPFYFVSYPFGWILPMVIFALLLFLGLAFVGFGKRILIVSEIGKGFLLFFSLLVISGLVGFLGWKLLLTFYPQYQDILHGFTYNGHDYITAFVFLTLAIGFLMYRKFSSENVAMNYTVAPLSLWIIINFIIAFLLPGAGFFIIPLFASLIGFGYFIITQRTSKFLNLLMAIPALIVFAPFITAFPIGLGLKMLFGSAVLVALVFGLLLPTFGLFSRKGNWSLVLFLIAIGFFVKAHMNANYEPGKAKPNSLLYVCDADTKKASWVTYDTNLDEWTKKYLGENPKPATALNMMPLFSKYGSKFTFASDAPEKYIERPEIAFIKDTIIGNYRHLKIRIAPQRAKVNRYDIFANEKMVFYNFVANGAKALGQKGSTYQRKDRKIVSYYVVDNAPLELQFSIDKNTPLDLSLMESSFDLLDQTGFAVAKRPSWMMPTPFVLNDAVVLKMKIKPNTTNPVLAPETALAPNTEIINDTIRAYDEAN